MKSKILKVRDWLKFQEPDYDGFVNHVKSWEKLGISYGTKELAELSKSYNTPVLYFVRDTMNIDVNIEQLIKNR